jgi:hypothetical protein
MGKHTETKKSSKKSSKKNYSFTGQRTIGNSKSKTYNAESNTTEEMINILQNDISHKPSNFTGNNMEQGQMMQNQMMQQQMMQQQMMQNQMMQNQMMQNQMIDIDPLLANTLAPVKNNADNFLGQDINSLMNSSQMAQNISGITNLSKIGNNSLINHTDQMSETIAGQFNMTGTPGMNSMGGIPGMNSMGGIPGMNSMGGIPGMNSMSGIPGMNSMNGMNDNGINNIKNLSELYNMNILKA